MEKFVRSPESKGDVNNKNAFNPNVFPKRKKFVLKSPKENSKIYIGTCYVDDVFRQYACKYEKCYNHKKCFKNESLIYQILHIHPDDKLVWRKQICPDIVNLFASFCEEKQNKCVISFNLRYTKRDGSIAQFLHKGKLRISHTTKLPIFTSDVFTEIKDIKSDDNIVLSIFQNNDDARFSKIFTKVYLNNQKSVLSLRELEIVKLCHNGLTSKMISDKLNLSIHTVKNHRRNCMEKTMTHNITELIHFCLEKNWIIV